MWPVISPDATPAANASGEWPTPIRRSTDGPKPERSTTRSTCSAATAALAPAMVSTSASNARPGFRPAPRTVTPRSRARPSISSAIAADVAHGYAASSAVVRTFEPASTAARRSSAISCRNDVVAMTTTSAPPRSARSRSARPNGPSTSNRASPRSARSRRSAATAVPACPAP
jgi:hypothetical protein